MPTLKKVSETKLAKRIVDYLRLQGWEVFQEVLCPNRRRVVDIYARKKHGAGYRTWAIEVKTSLNLAVMEQAHYWTTFAHQVSIAVPPKKNKRIKNFGYKICALLGLGVLELKPREVQEVRQPRQTSVAQFPTLVTAQKTSTAGTNKRDHWTHFKQTIQNLNELVQKQPGITLDEAIDQIEHHYRHKNSAKSSLRTALRKRIVTGITYRRYGNIYYLYPKK